MPVRGDVLPAISRKIRTHAERHCAEPAADRHRKSNKGLAGGCLEPADSSPLPAAPVVRHRVDPEQCDDRNAAQAARDRRIDRAAHHVLREHDVESPEIPQQIQERFHLIGGPPSLDRLDVQPRTACGDPVCQAAHLELPRWRGHGQIADFGQARHEADVGKPLAEVQHLHVRETPIARRRGNGRSVSM